MDGAENRWFAHVMQIGNAPVRRGSEESLAVCDNQDYNEWNCQSTDESRNRSPNTDLQKILAYERPQLSDEEIHGEICAGLRG